MNTGTGLQARMTYKLATDGASRGNPGPASIAYTVHDANGTLLREHAATIGEATNNEAEYEALLHALRHLTDETNGRVHHVSDSQLVVRQLTGAYQVKAAHLRPLHEEASKLKARFDAVHHEHAPRTDTRIQRVDELANQALDEA